VDCAFDACREACAQIQVAAGSSGLAADYLDHALCEKAPDDLADADWPHPWLLIQGHDVH
jgi:hypothetical protein